MLNLNRKIVVFISVLVVFGSAIPTYTGYAAAQGNAAYKAAADYSTQHKGLAVVIYKSNQIVFERYDNGGSASKVVGLASGTKSFNCATAVAAQVDGLLTLDEKAADTLTEWHADPRKSQITIRQLLAFSSGIKGDEAEWKAAVTSDVYQESIQAPAVYAPGAVYRYDPTQTSAFNELMTRKLKAAKINEDPLAYLTRRLFTPIGLQIGGWRRDIHDNPLMAGGASLTAREWLKYGQFMLAGGLWNGKQILPADKLAECVQPSTTYAGYGLNWWLNAPVPKGQITPEFAIPMDGKDIYPGGPKDLYMAAGTGKERLYVIPSQKMVIVRFAEMGDRGWDDEQFLKLAGI